MDEKTHNRPGGEYVEGILPVRKTDQMATQIYENNIPELRHIYSKAPGPDSRSTLSPLISTRHPDLGSFHVSNMVFPDLHLMDIQWSIPDELIIHESSPSQTVDINFVIEGNITGSYKGLDTDLALIGGTNNFKFTPSEKSSHRAVRQDVNMFAIALEKAYFQNLIGYESSWAENIQRKIESGIDFFASDRFVGTTPRMHSLIHSIRTMAPAPMTRIMTQSLLLELIALQVEQLACLKEMRTTSDPISAIDTEKLYNAKKYIDQHFLEDLTLTRICREVMLNEFKLKKGFKTLFNSSVIQYVRQLRMELAQHLLRDSKMTVEEVSGKLGYRYPNHFSAAYKKHFGVVPSMR